MDFKLKIFKILLFVCCMYMIYVGMFVSWHMYGGEELCGFCVLLLPTCGFHGLDSGCQACATSTFAAWAMPSAPEGGFERTNPKDPT